MTPDLTDQQRQALHETNDAGPVTIVDPATHTQYVLVRADVFQELQHWARDLEPPDAYPLVDRIMTEDDANDPLLASYQGEALPREPA
ncbi:MAG: hypothetical protein ABR915_09950 [Thermoguttaceae bacterium]